MPLLLKEYNSLCAGGFCQDLLTEDERQNAKDKGYQYLTGILQQADTLNGNNRIYSKSILEREMKIFNKLVEDRRSLGTLDHEESEIVTCENASHLITRTWWDNNAVMGVMEVLDTPKGLILQEFLKRNIKMGISSRGLGSIREENGQTIVEDDYQLVTFDVVLDPSTPNAFLSPVQLSEAQARKMLTKADRMNRMMNDILRGDQ